MAEPTPSSAPLLPCPFCGDTPRFAGDGENWQDDDRYVQMEAVCCVRMSAALGWRSARDMLPAARESILKEKLAQEWNNRAPQAVAAPKHPPMPEQWSVVAEVDGQDILCISSNALSGKGELSEAEEQAVIGMAQHLLSFVGYGLPPCSFNPDEQAVAAQAPAVGWINVADRLPPAGTPVLLDTGGKYPIRAMWAAKHTIEAGDEDPDWGEYVEADDMYYCPEGWYEWNAHEETHWSVSAKPIAWMPIPLTTPALPATEDSSAGEQAEAQIRWTAGGKIYGRPTTHDLREALTQALQTESRVCTCPTCVQADKAEVQAEPVMIYHGRCTIDCGEHGHHDVEMLKMIPSGAKLYTAPQAQPADALTATPPKSNTLWRLLTNGYDWDYVSGGHMSERDQSALETRANSIWAAICTEASPKGVLAQPSDASLLDYLQFTGSTVEIIPGPTGWNFRVGGLHTTVHSNLRCSIDAAMAAAQEGGNAAKEA